MGSGPGHRQRQAHGLRFRPGASDRFRLYGVAPDFRQRHAVHGHPYPCRHLFVPRMDQGIRPPMALCRLRTCRPVRAGRWPAWPRPSAACQPRVPPLARNVPPGRGTRRSSGVRAAACPAPRMGYVHRFRRRRTRTAEDPPRKRISGPRPRSMEAAGARLMDHRGPACRPLASLDAALAVPSLGADRYLLQGYRGQPQATPRPGLAVVQRHRDAGGPRPAWREHARAVDAPPAAFGRPDRSGRTEPFRARQPRLFPPAGNPLDCPRPPLRRSEHLSAVPRRTPRAAFRLAAHAAGIGRGIGADLRARSARHHPLEGAQPLLRRRRLACPDVPGAGLYGSDDVLCGGWRSCGRGDTCGARSGSGRSGNGEGAF